MKILITGGAGFIGSRLARQLVEASHEITVLDSLSPQVHPTEGFPVELQKIARCVQGDIRDAAAVERVLDGVEVVVHLAAETGTGQSMYDIRRYCDVNVGGTANLLDVIQNRPNGVRRIVLAGSRAVYGEGQYECEDGKTVYPAGRSLAQLDRHEWELTWPGCDGPIKVVPTQETARLQPGSIYASNKQTQEQLVSITCQGRELEAVILRYQNVYGPGQALTNPYTGVICAFFSRIIANKPITLFEDGEISRDFVYIDDVTAATAAAVQSPLVGQQVINVGTGVRTTIREVADNLREILGLAVPVEVSGRYRVGDIRHCYADITRLREKLGYRPKWDFNTGLRQFVEWALTQREMVEQIGNDLDRANAELTARKLFR